MTAFARREADGIAWELRSVNHRYLDPSFKLPEDLRGLEAGLRNALKESLFRGKIDCVLKLNNDAVAREDLIIDTDQLHRLRQALDQISAIMGPGQPASALELLSYPGVAQRQATEDKETPQKVEALFTQALSDLCAMRAREGAELEAIIQVKLDELQRLTDAVRAEAPLINERQKRRLDERLSELQVEPDAGRLEQELVYLAQKSDIAEELDRLDTHIEEVRSTLLQNGAVGRRLDFLMQELNREANTLSSKAQAASTAIQAVALKVVIEQMREQVQNIE